MIRPPFIASSRPALEAAEFAREKGKFDAFHLGLFKAYWEEGRNIGLRDVIRKVAEESGLDGEELDRALEERRFREAVDEQVREAAALGINGIPAFIVGKYFIEGAQPYSVFQRAARLSLKEKAS